MLDFPHIPSWWPNGTKFMKLQKGFRYPSYIVGYDTETYKGSILTQQFFSNFGKKIEWVNDDNVFDKFLDYLEELSGYIVVYCFNAKFDLPLLMRKFIHEFLKDDFHIKYRGWEIDVFCSKNWYANFKYNGRFVRFLDIYNFFKGSLDTVAKTFNLSTKKLERPELLGYKKFGQNDKKFIDYAIKDAELGFLIGNIIVDMHSEFDIPISTSSANFAEKVFRRNFLKDGERIKFTPPPATRLSEISYHGGKNGYYIGHPCFINKVYEYDFNSAYPYAMYNLPTFLDGKYKLVNKFNEKRVGIYQVTGWIEPCKYGILYDTRFQYFRFQSKEKIRSFVTSFELKEAIKSGEFKLDTCKGWIWIPNEDERNPIKEYARYFWEMKNKTHKGDVKYLFYKLLMNSLYGKWIQRNPIRKAQLKVGQNDQIELWRQKDTTGGLYHPFIASLITGHVRARLHNAEHFFDAIESSTDSVKTRKYYRNQRKGFGLMQLEKFHCKECKEDISKPVGLFLRNRLNLLMCPKQHVLKAALHGFWGNTEKLKELWKRKDNFYQIERMPLIRESLKHEGKSMFQTMGEERTINIDWRNYKEY